MKPITRVFISLSIILLAYGDIYPQEQEQSKQVVRLIATKQEFDHFSPWAKKGQQKVMMNGTVVGKNLILTSAYSLADVTMIEAVKHGESKRYPANIVVNDYYCGLALLTVSGEDFFSDLVKADLLEPQKLIGHSCSIYRWDADGNFREYSADAINTSLRIYKPNCGVLTHTMATDMEAGGYGEPVFKDGKLAGISTGFDNVTKGIIAIGADTIKRMLDDIADGSYEGLPFFWIQGLPLEGDVNLREYLGIGPKDTGVYIDRIHPLSSGKNEMKQGDVIVSIDGFSIEDSGLYHSKFYERLNFNGLIYLNHFVNDTVEMTVIRNKEKVPLRFKLEPISAEKMAIPLIPYDKQPDYLIVGGCVFQHLTLGYMKTWGDTWEKQCDRRLFYFFRHKEWESAGTGDKIIVLNRVLPAAVNSGYQDMSNLVLESINGIKVRNIVELKKAVSSITDTYLKFDFTGKTTIILNRKKANHSEEDILRTYHIPKSWSTGEGD